MAELVPKIMGFPSQGKISLAVCVRLFHKFHKTFDEVKREEETVKGTLVNGLNPGVSVTGLA